MNIQRIATDSLKPNPRNARTHSTKQIHQIAESVKQFGFIVPIAIDEKRTILAGHGRHAAAKLLRLTEVPVVEVAGLSPSKKRALALADNKIAENAGWDRETLAVELSELAELLIEEDLDISITGFAAVEMIAECERREVFTLAVTTTPRAWPRNHELASPTKYVRAALGLHPQLVQDHAKEIELWREYLSRARYVGEVGLDAGPRFYASFNMQKRIFETILRDCANRGEKILTIHSVRAVRAVLDMIEAHLPPSRGATVLHWFTGSRSEAQRAVSLGCYFSINQEMLRNEKHQTMVASLPLDRLLTETDGPFVKIDGRDARPSDVSQTLEALARTRSMPASELAETVALNLKRLVAHS